MDPNTYTTNLPVDILATLSVVIVICIIRKVVAIFPHLVKCLFKWKESIALEYSVKLSRDRNAFFYAMIIPACLMLDRYAPSFPRFMDGMHPTLHLGLTFAIFIVFILLRLAMMHLSRRPKTDSLAYSSAYHLFRTVFCLTVTFCLATAGIMTLAHCPVEIVKTVIFYEIVLFYLVFLFREGEILGHYCSLLTTILYLCTLELIPVLFLVILWIV